MKWRNAHSASCPVTAFRDALPAADMTEQAREGARIELDAGGDDEAENCMCGVAEEYRDHDAFLRVLDGIIESCTEFIRDDGPDEAMSHVSDLAAAARVRDAYLSTWAPEGLRAL